MKFLKDGVGQEYQTGVYNYIWFKVLGTANKWCLVKYLSPGGYVSDVAGFKVKKFKDYDYTLSA